MAVRRGSPFGPGLIRFLKDLESNNNRDWFLANKDRYEEEVREPALAFIHAMGPRLTRISDHLVASERKVGGSLMRIHRDVRFSKDKQPYKTNLGIQFRHEAGKDVHAPGLYFHVDKSGAFLASGMWRPDTATLTAVRRAIADDPRGWKRVRDAKRFREHWELSGASLKRPPRGYEADHPLLEDLKRKDHIAVNNLKKSDLTRSDLLPLLSDRFERTKNYLGWLARGIGMPF